MITNKSKIPKKEDCPVCDERLIIEPVRIIPRTQAMAHSDCLWLHFQQKNTCPATNTILDKPTLKKDCTTLGLQTPKALKRNINPTNETLQKARIIGTGGQPKTIRRKKKHMTLAMASGSRNKMNFDSVKDPHLNSDKMMMLQKKFSKKGKGRHDGISISELPTYNNLSNHPSPKKNQGGSSQNLLGSPNEVPVQAFNGATFSGRNAARRFTRRQKRLQSTQQMNFARKTRAAKTMKMSKNEFNFGMKGAEDNLNIINE